MRSLFAFEKRTKLANALTTTNYNVICLTETRLTEDVPDEALFIQQYHIYRAERPNETTSSKHGGVLNGMNPWIKHDLIRIEYG